MCIRDRIQRLGVEGRIRAIAGDQRICLGHHVFDVAGDLGQIAGGRRNGVRGVLCGGKGGVGIGDRTAFAQFLQRRLNLCQSLRQIGRQRLGRIGADQRIGAVQNLRGACLLYTSKAAHLGQLLPQAGRAVQGAGGKAVERLPVHRRRNLCVRQKGQHRLAHPGAIGRANLARTGKHLDGRGCVAFVHIQNLATVSYTHLDVYKRQSLG